MDAKLLELPSVSTRLLLNGSLSWVALLPVLRTLCGMLTVRLLFLIFLLMTPFCVRSCSLHSHSVTSVHKKSARMLLKLYVFLHWADFSDRTMFRRYWDLQMTTTLRSLIGDRLVDGATLTSSNITVPRRCAALESIFHGTRNVYCSLA